MKGKVNYYNIVEGYGSFKTETGEDLTFHRKVLPVGMFLNEGDCVEFDIIGSDNAPEIKNVKKL